MTDEQLRIKLEVSNLTPEQLSRLTGLVSKIEREDNEPNGEVFYEYRRPSVRTRPTNPKSKE